jgi:hypothetical protein
MAVVGYIPPVRAAIDNIGSRPHGPKTTEFVFVVEDQPRRTLLLTADPDTHRPDRSVARRPAVWQSLQVH